MILLPFNTVELVQVPPDNKAPDLTCASANLVQFGVTQKPASRVVVDVPIATCRESGLGKNSE